MRHFLTSLRQNRILYTYLAAAVLIALAVVMGLSVGSSGVGIFDIISALLRGETDSGEARIFLYVRLPRLLASLLCGGALALSGVIIQSVLANRLAAPSIIGVNSGAGLAVTAASACGILGGWALSLFAFLGAFLTVIIVSLGSRKWGASRGTVILIGVALNSLFGAVTDTLTTIFPDLAVMSNDFKIGDFSSVTYVKLFGAAILIVLAVIVVLSLYNELDVLTLGEETAKGLGMNTALMRPIFLLLAALLAGASVSLCGMLSFVGLIVPHLVRRVATSHSRHLLPLSFMLGAGFVSLSDTIARVILAPYELPVGIIMAFIGAPFFIFILVKGKGGHRNA